MVKERKKGRRQGKNLEGRSEGARRETPVCVVVASFPSLSFFPLYIFGSASLLPRHIIRLFLLFILPILLLNFDSIYVVLCFVLSLHLHRPSCGEHTTNRSCTHEEDCLKP